MEIARLEVSTQRHIDQMWETAKVNICSVWERLQVEEQVQIWWKIPRYSDWKQWKHWKPSKSSGKGRKVPLPTDISWRCCKGRHQKGQPCKAVEAVCRNCSIKGHYEKVCIKGKCSTHLVNVPEASTSSTSDQDYYHEH